MMVSSCWDCISICGDSDCDAAESARTVGANITNCLACNFNQFNLSSFSLFQEWKEEHVQKW